MNIRASTNNFDITFRTEILEKQQESAKTKSELSDLKSTCKTIESQSHRKDKQITKQHKKINMLENNLQKYVQQVSKKTLDSICSGPKRYHIARFPPSLLCCRVLHRLVNALAVSSRSRFHCRALSIP